MSDSYLVIEPERPTPEEYARGAKLIPSMMDEGVRVWRVPQQQQGVAQSAEHRIVAPGTAVRNRTP